MLSRDHLTVVRNTMVSGGEGTGAKAVHTTSTVREQRVTKK